MKLFSIFEKRKTHFLYFAIGGFFILLSGCKDQDASSDQYTMPAPAVSVMSVGSQQVGEYREYVAHTKALNSVSLIPQISGVLRERNFDEGASVEKGQLLFVIDPDKYVAILEQKKANLFSARVTYAQAKKTLKRNEELFKKKHISQSILDIKKSDKENALSAIISAKAGLKLAKLDVDNTRIYAPFSGKIGKANYSIGSVVSSGRGGLATLLSTNPISVTFQINEQDYVDFIHKKNVTGEETRFDLSLELPNGDTYNHKGILKFVDNQIDKTVGTLMVTAEFSNPEGIIVPGMYVKLMVENHQKLTKNIIPKIAVQEGLQGSFVLVVNEDNKVEARPVKMGRRLGLLWVVESGLQLGEYIILEGLQKVRPKIKVRPVLVNFDSNTGNIIPTQSTKME